MRDLVNSIFTVDLGRNGLPDIGLSLVLLAIGARRLREHGDDDPTGKFITALGTAVRRGPDGEVSGRVDTGDLDHAARLMALEELESAILPVRADSIDTARALTLLVGRWAEFCGTSRAG
jgi:hypothetical protein